MSKLIAFILLLSAGTIFGQTGDAAGKSPLSVKFILPKNEYEVGEVTDCTIEIKNMGTEAVLLPRIALNSGKGADGPDVGFFVQKKMLKLDLRRDGKSLSMRKEVLETPALTNRDYPVVSLSSGQAFRSHFELNAYYAFYYATNPGIYSVNVTLDTRACEEAEINKGVFTSEAVAFRIVSVPIFRAQQTDESPEAYHMARIAFFFGRIARNQGDGLRNDAEIRNTDGFVPALIGLLGSADKEIAARASSLLQEVFPRPSNSTNWVGVNSDVPKSAEEWTSWWNETGSKLPPGKLSQNRYWPIQ